MQVPEDNNLPFPSFLDLPFSKGYTDLPSFEDAFDTISLRKFYQEQESTNSQSNFSPRKTSSMTEENFFGDFEGRDFPFSPFPFKTSHNPFASLPQIEDDFPNLFNEPQNFASDSFFPRRARSHFIPRTLDTDIFPQFAQPFQIAPPKGNIPENKPQTPFEENTFNPIANPPFQFAQQAQELPQRQTSPGNERFNITTSKEAEENLRFERLIKGKKIFKIIKPSTNNKTVVANLRIKAAKSEGVPEIPKVKRGLSDSANFSGKFISFNFNMPQKGNGLGTNPGNFVKLIPKGPAQNLKNVFSIIQENKPKENLMNLH